MGFDLHMRNLRWAFSNFEHKIFLQTFSEYGFQEAEDLKITAYDADPKDFFQFYENLHIDWGDLIVLVQQDNLFANKVDPTVEICKRGPIVTWDQDTYFSIYNHQNEMIYPRIAEISTFMRRELVEEMKYYGLCYGERGRQFAPTGVLYNYFYPLLQSFRIHSKYWLKSPDCFETLAEFCHRERKDTMFDISFYSFCTGKPVRHLHPAQMVHMSNPEMFHRELPEAYASSEELLKVNVPEQPHFRKNIPNVALMCLLSGVYEKDRAVSEALKQGRESFRFRLAQLHKTATEWMSDDQLDRLNWAVIQVEAA